MRLIVGISGASGVIMGYQMLKALKQLPDMEVHLIITAEISASASVLCRLGHKDDLPAREAALRLASKFNTNVAVTAGLHIDDADSDDITKLQHNFQQILEAIEAWLQTIDI